MPKWLTFDTVVRYVGQRRMDNDQTNLQPLIPAHTMVDVRIGGEIEKFFWSFAVLNLFDVDYFDYAIASPFPNGFASYARHLQCLSAAGPQLHAQGRRDLVANITLEKGPLARAAFFVSPKPTVTTAAAATSPARGRNPSASW